MKPKTGVSKIHDDAKPQFVRTRKGASNSGVSSAEPRVITGDEDATFDTDPERKTKQARKA
jgi:hypothetical protein